MTPRDTRTGVVLEQMILPSLTQGGYHYRRNAVVGRRLGGGRHKVDVLAWNSSGRTILLSLKWQQSAGTAEQKVPYEVMCLVHALEASGVDYSDILCQVHGDPHPGNTGEVPYIVIGGLGWKPSLKEFYLSGGLNDWVRRAGEVRMVGLEDFTARANQGRL